MEDPVCLARFPLLLGATSAVDGSYELLETSLVTGTHLIKVERSVYSRPQATFLAAGQYFDCQDAGICTSIVLGIEFGPASSICKQDQE